MADEQPRVEELAAEVARLRTALERATRRRRSFPHPGYFWLPCPLCGEMFGGHEWRDGPNGEPSSIPVAGHPGRSEGICPECTREGRGERIPPAWMT